MGQLDLTVQVLNLSPKVTLEELNTFFSYCGFVDKIQRMKVGNQSESTLVSFRQPYAFQTALLLNDAVLGGQPIRILPSRDDSVPVDFHYGSAAKPQKDEAQELIPIVQAKVMAMAVKGAQTLNKTKDEVEATYNEKKRMVAEQTRSAIAGTECAISAAAGWTSGLLDGASKWVYAVGNRKRDDPNYRKQK